MSETIHVELNREQQSLLLEGLSYLRNCALLEVRFPSEESDREREQQVREIDELAEQLGGSQSRTHASV
jgi:hypothetical protein